MKYLKFSNYIKFLKTSLKLIYKKKQVLFLLRTRIHDTKLYPVWDVPGTDDSICIQDFTVFGVTLPLSEIQWHRDYLSGFDFPVSRFDTMNFEQWFDKGVEIKFPWEVSRFNFAILLARSYLSTKDLRYYHIFRKQVLDWIEKNPYLFGVNWACTMEVAIRAMNWIVAANMFGETIQQDDSFLVALSRSLVQHAEYISRLPEWYHNVNSTNHTTADFAGLLFLAMTLGDHKKSGYWQQQAMTSLVKCMQEQVFDDGVDFEGSIPYHRLVLEIFGYTAVLCNANHVKLPQQYFLKLFRMFEYTAAYMDCDGNAPQVGDNDSGRIFVFQQSDEQDHSYLLDLGEQIFAHRFLSQCKKRNRNFHQYLPVIGKMSLEEMQIEPRQTNKSIAFKDGGAYLLKSEKCSLFISCFPVGQNGVGGHNHNDFASFVLSCNGRVVFSDPGTLVYSSNICDRNEFRATGAHSTLQIKDVEQYETSAQIKDLWRLKSKNELDVESYSSNDDVDELCLYQKLKVNGNKVVHKRKYRLIKKQNCVEITDQFTTGEFNGLVAHINFILHPSISISQLSERKMILSIFNPIAFETNYPLEIKDSRYSPGYQIEMAGKKLTGHVAVSDQSVFWTEIKIN